MVTALGIKNARLLQFLDKNKQIFNYSLLANNLVKIETSLEGLIKLYEEGFDKLQVLTEDNYLSIKNFLKREITLKALKEGVKGLKYQQIYETKTLQPIGAEFFCNFAFHPFVLIKFLEPLDLAFLDLDCVELILKETYRYRKTKKVFINTFHTSWNFDWFKGATVELLEKEPRQLRPNIVLEVVETGTVDLKIFGCLKKAFSIRVALDDFGAESASLERLSADFVDYVKLDKKLLWDEKLFKFLKGLASELNKQFKVIAEGVETEEHLKKIRELEIPYAQGFFLDKPKVWSKENTH